MKKLLITLSLFFTILPSSAQKSFEGVWVTPGSTYETVILVSDYEVLQIINYSFKEHAQLEEKILTQTDTTMTTKIYNQKNGYKILMSYTVIDENKLECKFTGDYNETLIINRKNYK
jgi:hypothetical protein